MLWLEAETILVRSIHEVLSKGLTSVVAPVAHVWVPHLVNVSVDEPSNQKVRM